MRDRYFTMYQEIKFNRYYFFHYLVRSTRIQNFFKGFLALATSASISSWLIWKQAEIVWGIIIASSQIIMAIEHIFPYSKRIATIRFLLPEIDELIYDIQYKFDTIDAVEDAKVSRLIFDFYLKYHQIEQRYISDTYLPFNKRCRKKAEEDNNCFFRFQYFEQNNTEVNING